VGLLGITHSEARVGQQVKDLVAQGVPPPGLSPDVVIARSPAVYFEESAEGETTLKYDLTVHLPFLDTVQAGGSFKTFRIGYAVESPYGNDTPYSPVPGIDPFVLDTRFRSDQSGAYLQASKQMAPRVNVTLGGRFDHYAILSQARFSPRAGVKLRLADTLSWNASAGTYYQQPAFLFVSAFPQNASLVPWRAVHYVTGLAWSPDASLRVTAEAYRKTYTNYPVASDLPTVSLANIGDTFDVREILFPLTSAGEGHSEGVEFFVEKRLMSKLYGQGNLSFSRTRHAGLDRVLRPSSFDYPFAFNLLGGYRLSPRWEVSARLSFLSGRPFTPYNEAVSTEQRRGVYDLTRANAERAPDYGRVDIRVDRTFMVGAQPLNVFVGVQNVTNRRNFAGYSWNRRTNTQQFGDQQGIFPILGLDWRF
jgi:outer membrane receptor for ferrienterochelin and colicin